MVASLERAPSTSDLSLGFLPIFPLMARSWCSAELLVSVNCGSHVSFLFSLYILSLSWSCLLFLFFFFTVVMSPPSCCLPFVFFASSFGTFIFDPLDRKEKGMIN